MVLVGAMMSAGPAVALSPSAHSTAVKKAPRIMLKACVDLKTYKAVIMPKRFYCPKNSKYISLTPIKHPVNKISISGIGAPIDGVTGKDGDVYIDILNLLIYGPRDNGVWGPPKSLVGAQGLPGATGPKGDTGPKGETGTAGAPGAPGSIGPQGPQGAVGDTGPAGPQGETGTAGVNGSTILTGNGAPSDTATGVNGDYYIDLLTANLYGPKAGGVWGAVISTVGPQGPQGIQGPPGPAGTSGYGSYGSFFDTSTFVVTATPVALPLNHTDVASGVSITGPTLSRITFANPGIYNIAFSTQLSKANANSLPVSIWLSYNGVAVPWSATDVYVGGSAGRNVAAWNFFVTAAGGGDYYELYIYDADGTATISVLSEAAIGPRPEIPGTILTVNQVGAYTPPL
jgi:hypothetical protein